ncbi:hypothetical protein BST81_17520 [Leptolyngbya sp. 'hensonii']|uniref:hypothetical protein n=1 Tax=Leptolyngbya sp. 'hensonii' TaxID=1922337 RepID=UPI00094F8E28|nr:hypothetical protein [Leptolyngbya sp. 'hensonii']OLP17150.1 hypothetical protein BST81_17520 [Leptolyngbya sp. 'hensonii']
MIFTPVSNDPFEHYFYKRAQLADDMADSGSTVDAYTLATASLDALAEIWFNDFPNVKRQLESELGGSVPSSIRLARLLKSFVPNDLRVSKVAVVCFAEDWKYYCPKDAHIADQLLSKRLSDNPNEFLRSHELPKSYLDVSRDELAQECPDLLTRPNLFDFLEEYEYGSLLYTFYRCPLVHLATGSRRTHGFTRGEEIMYYWSSSDDERITISFGPKLVTRWLRNVVSGYVQSCQEKGIVPADKLDAGTSQEKRFSKRWEWIRKRWECIPLL